MNKKLIVFFKNVSYTLSSNLINLLVSAMLIFILPKLMTIEEYAYLQLFIFYSSYLPFLQFGWSDGIYLRYSGSHYKEINKNVFFSQFISLLFMQLIFSVSMILYSYLFIDHSNQEFILYALSLFLVIVNVRYFFMFLLQSTSRFKEASSIILIDRFIYVGIVIVLLTFGYINFKVVIIADLIAKLCSVCLGIYYCRDVVFTKLTKFKIEMDEYYKNIIAGFKLTLSNTTSMLIIGVYRFSIEKTWDIATFGKVSLVLTISNFVMVFINAINVVLLPTIKKIEINKISKIYIDIRNILMLLLFAILLVYFPLKKILSVWLPDYSDSLLYLLILLPLCIYEGKMGLLVNTVLKALRKESLMLKINISSLAISALIAYITILLFKNLDLAILSILISLIIRSVIAEVILSKLISVSVYKEIIFEISFTFIFIFAGWYLTNALSFFITLIVYTSYLFLKRNIFKDLLQSIKK